MSGQERLGAAVKQEWAQAYATYEDARMKCAATQGHDHVLEHYGDELVSAAAVRALWDMVVEAGSVTGDWRGALTHAARVGQDIISQPRQRGLIGFAVGQVRAMALQAVLTRIDELLPAYGGAGRGPGLN